MSVHTAPALCAIRDASEEEKRRKLQEVGFGVIYAYSDIQHDLVANEMACELYRRKLREVVADPATAQGLIGPGGLQAGAHEG